MMDQNLADAYAVDSAIESLLVKRGASDEVLNYVEGVAVHAVKLFGTPIRNPGERSIEPTELAIAVLKQIVQDEEQVLFKRRCLKELRKIVEAL
jgi:hypothetical protein